MTDQETTQQEPTMEEILASIRRIISEDNDDAAKASASNGAAPVSAAAPAQPAPVEEPAPIAQAAPMAAAPAAPMAAAAPAAPAAANNGLDTGGADVLELTQAQVLPDPEPAQPLHQPQETVSSFHQPAPEPVAPVQETAPAEDEFAGSDLMVVEEEETAAEDSTANSALVTGDTEDTATEAFRALNRDVAISRAANGVQTLETMVEDMMRPMLKNWLDDNLGEIVEDVVEREVRRIADRSRTR